MPIYNIEQYKEELSYSQEEAEEFNKRLLRSDEVIYEFVKELVEGKYNNAPDTENTSISYYRDLRSMFGKYLKENFSIDELSFMHSYAFIYHKYLMEKELREKS
jgi:hypothetical protein